MQAAMTRTEIEAVFNGMPDILEPREVATFINCTPKSVRDKCISGQIKAFKYGTLWKIPKVNFIDYLEVENARK